MRYVCLDYNSTCALKKPLIFPGLGSCLLQIVEKTIKEELSMIKLAEWDGQRFYLYKQISTEEHLVLVEDEDGSSAFFKLETCAQLLSADSPNPKKMNSLREAKARRFIRDSKNDFLDYLSELK